MSTRLRRDGQRWVHDWVVAQTGVVQHFQGGRRGWLPPTIRQHDMISKQVGLGALRLQRLADEEREQGHERTALELYFEAAGAFANAQHPILDDTTEEKRKLHRASLDCIDAAAELAPYPLERVSIPWEERSTHANLHLLPGDGPAPCVIFIPGCDMTKEMFPHPAHNQAHARGMHLVSIDGPGQGELAMEGTWLTADNYESSVSAVIDYLRSRDEIDSDRIALWGLSFSTLWALQVAASDRRVAAVAAPWASFADLHYLLNMESPRFKQVLAYMTQAESEDELDEIISGMQIDDRIADISCPTLVTVGEYDPRSPLELTVELYDRMTCERELWIFADQHHVNTISGRINISERGVWDLEPFSWTLDWLGDRFAGRPIEESGAAIWMGRGATTPHGPRSGRGRTWIEAMGLE